MSNKIITTVVALLILIPFIYIATADAVSIKRDLEKQSEHVQVLSTEYQKLNKQLDSTQTTKDSTAEEVQKLDQQMIDATNERQKLEAALRAS